MKTNWEEIKTEYKTTDVSYKELADKFNVNKKTLESRALREKWADERKAFKGELRQELEGAAIEENIKTFKEASEIIRKELMIELVKNIDIRKNITDDEQWAEKRISTCIDNNKKVYETLDKMAYPQREDKTDNNITVVLGDEKIKEYVK